MKLDSTIKLHMYDLEVSNVDIIENLPGIVGIDKKLRDLHYDDKKNQFYYLNGFGDERYLELTPDQVVLMKHAADFHSYIYNKRLLFNNEEK